MKVLVTGYGGFLGKAIATQLLDRGDRVVGFARQLYPEMVQRGVEPFQGDLSDAAAVSRVCQSVDAIIHTAAKAGVWGSYQSYYQINTQGTLNLLDQAKRQGIGCFVYSSSPSVTFDGKHQSGIDESVPYPSRWLCHYPHTKAIAEKAVLDANQVGKLTTCALRPHLIWGEGDPHLIPRLIQRSQQGKLRRVGSGDNRIDTVHVDSAARAHLLALDRLVGNDRQVCGESFFITDGDPIACWEWIRLILTHAGVKVPERTISMGSAYRIGAVLERLYSLFRISEEPPMTRFVALQLGLDHYFSIDKAKQRLGYDPTIDRKAIMRGMEPWLRSVAAR